MEDTQATAGDRPGGTVRAWLTVVTVSIIASTGYGGFRLASRIDLGAETGAGLIALSVITGFAVFFSPCSFPLLVALLARPVRTAKDSHQRRTGLAAALAIGTGASLFLLFVGVIVGLAGEGVAQSVGFSTLPGRALRAGVASIILTAGLVQLNLVQLPLSRMARLAAPIGRRRAAISNDHEHGANVLYGFGFILAGFG